MSVMVVLKGGAGSGFFGHRGRPGEEGGSLPRGSNSAGYMNRFIAVEGTHIEAMKKYVKTSYFHEDKLHELNKTLAKSIQQQYEVLGFDPMEMMRRSHSKIYLLDDNDFEKWEKYWHNKVDQNVIGFISSHGSMYLKCGRWSHIFRNGEISEYDLYESLEVGTINHEFGHILMDTTNPGWYIDNLKGWQISSRKAIDDWVEGYKKGDIGHHTNYSNKNEREGFAESYMSYVATGGVSTDPEVSRTYEFVKKVIDAARLKYAK
ncbi:MAG: hypothetical protein WC479_04475 [Candidatus Izemoplasmatales bacterium]